MRTWRKFVFLCSLLTQKKSIQLQKALTGNKKLCYQSSLEDTAKGLITQHNEWQDLFFRILPNLSSLKFHTITTAPQALPFFSFFPNSWPPKLCQIPSLLSVAAFPEWGWKEIPSGLSTLLLRSIHLPLPSLQRLLRTKPGEEEKQCIFTCEYFCPVAFFFFFKRLEGKTHEC